MALLEVVGLSKTFRTRWGIGRNNNSPAVHDVSFAVERGETLSLVGESGAGKSTTGRLAIRLIEPDEGQITFDGRDLRSLNARDLRATRQKMQMVFQDPYSCLDPRIPIAETVGEPLLVHFKMGSQERRKRAAEALERVGLRRHFLDRFPHELSGGQLQRVAIARALTLSPDLIVCDEPVAALDVSVRAQVLNLLSELQDELGLAYLFISHDLALVEVLSDRVAVMRNGRIVEVGTPQQIFDDPQHEYTKMLRDAIPTLERVGTR